MPSLGGVDLSAVFGISVTAGTRQRLEEIDHCIDLLRPPADEGGWVIGSGPQVVADGRPLPLAVGTAIGRHYQPDDWLELALDVWYAGRDGLLVTAAVEVACFCPEDHGMHPAANAEWAAQSEAELLIAFDAALDKLAAWSGDDSTPDVWRRRAGLPPR